MTDWTKVSDPFETVAKDDLNEETATIFEPASMIKDPNAIEATIQTTDGRSIPVMANTITRTVVPITED